MKAPRYVFSDELTINEVLSLSWAIEFAAKQLDPGKPGCPQPGAAKKFKRFEERSWRDYDKWRRTNLKCAKDKRVRL
jgi:hypothetical protein